MFLLFNIFGSLLLNAHADTYLEIGGSQIKCEQISKPIFHCNNDDNKVLVFKKNNGYVIIEQKGPNAPTFSLGIRLVNNNETLYENNSSFSTYENGKIKSKTELIENSERVIDLLKDIDDPWALDFINASEKNIKALRPLSPRKVEVKTSSGEAFSCIQGQLDKEIEKINSKKGKYGFLATCDYYSCEDKKQNKILAFIPSPNSLYNDAHFFKLDGEKTERYSNGFNVYDSNFSDDFPSFNLPDNKNSLSTKSNQSEIEKDLFVPKKYQTNSNAFKYLTDAGRVNSFKEKEKYCVGNEELLNLIKEKNSITQKMIKDLEESELVQYLSMTDGKIISLIANASRANEIGCSYDDMILSPAAWEKVRYLQRLKVKEGPKDLTPKEVQELFIKASKMSDIPFAYKEEGCYARAHLMARRFEKMGIPTEKVWIKGSLLVPGTDIGWDFHVAPVVRNYKICNRSIPY
jgi:hypothetical protein